VAPVSSRTIIDNDHVKVILTGPTFKQGNGTVFEISIENKSDEAIWLTIRDVSINGKKDPHAEIDTFSLAAHSTVDAYLYFETASKLTDLINVRGTLEVYDARTDSRIRSYQISYTYEVAV